MSSSGHSALVTGLGAQEGRTLYYCGGAVDGVRIQACLSEEGWTCTLEQDRPHSGTYEIRTCL